MTFHFFNPENDLALALGDKHYNPPKNIVRFSEDLSLLPVWYAEVNDCVLSRTHVPADWMQKERNELSVKSTWRHIDEYLKESIPSDVLSPWGWNYSLYNMWKNKGSSVQIIDCGKIREISGRSIVCDILTLPSIKGEIVPASFVQPKILTNWNQVCSFVHEYKVVVLKAPWSSSGKGLYWVEDECSEALKRWTRNLFAKQGYIMGEKVYEKEKDFAMEFKSENGDVSFLGYSFFQTEDGKYKGNILASDDWMKGQLSQYVHPSVLQNVITILCGFFTSRIAPYYRGYFGVDMMVVKSEVGYFIHPCVEVNLRMNMGVVSHILNDRYVQKDHRGYFFVTTFPTHEALLEFHASSQHDYPLEIANSRIIKGYMPLTYFQNDATSLAGMIVE